MLLNSFQILYTLDIVRSAFQGILFLNSFEMFRSGKSAEDVQVVEIWRSGALHRAFNMKVTFCNPPVYTYIIEFSFCEYFKGSISFAQGHCDRLNSSSFVTAGG